MQLNPEPTMEYFREKFKMWESEGEKLEKYTSIDEKKRIMNDLEKDANILKTTVCPYIKQAGYLQARSTLLQAAESLAGKEFNFPVVGTIDLVLGALMDACGYVRRGDSLLEADL